MAQCWPRAHRRIRRFAHPWRVAPTDRLRSSLVIFGGSVAAEEELSEGRERLAGPAAADAAGEDALAVDVASSSNSAALRLLAIESRNRGPRVT